MLSAELVRTILDSAPDAMVIADSSGTMIFANHRMTELFGYERSEVIGRSVDMLLPDRFRQRHLEHRLAYMNCVRARPMGQGLDLFALRKNGTEFPVEISLSPIANEDSTLVGAAIRDVTDRRLIQTELAHARVVAERADQAKTRFLTTASHDLRQPVQALALLNGAMRRMVHDPDLAEALEQQEQAIEAMSQLLNALLDIGRLESGSIKAELRRFEVADIFAQLREEFAGLAAERGLRLEIEATTCIARSDPALVGQVLRNLLSNAIKYTQEGKVHLRCQTRGAEVLVEMLDTGIGMASESLPQIFDEFYQVGVPTHSSREGYGLGLSIVRRILRLLDHPLEVRSKLGRGSTFVLTMPSDTSTPRHATASPTSVDAAAFGRGGALRVLIVEDDPRVRKAMRLLLLAEGYNVSTAVSLGEALQVATDQPDIALLVTDFHLDGLNTGVQVAAALRAKLAPDLPVIVITGDAVSAHREFGRTNGIRIVGKPVNAEELVLLLRLLTVT